MIIEDSTLEEQIISKCSQIIGIDIKFLLQNPNQIVSYFEIIEDIANN